MTKEEAKVAVKAALTTGPASAVKAALLQYHIALKEEEASFNALVATAQEIFTPQMGQMNL